MLSKSKILLMVIILAEGLFFFVSVAGSFHSDMYDNFQIFQKRTNHKLIYL